MFTDKPKTELTEEEKTRIVNKFNQILPKISCPMCKESDFVLGNGYINNVMQFHLNGISLSGKSIPTIPIICQNCGFVSQHALKIIDLLPNINQK